MAKINTVLLVPQQLGECRLTQRTATTGAKLVRVKPKFACTSTKETVTIKTADLLDWINQTILQQDAIQRKAAQLAQDARRVGDELRAARQLLTTE